MKNIINDGSANCKKLIGCIFLPITFRNIMSKDSVKNILQVSNNVFKGRGKKLVILYCRLFSLFLLSALNISGINAQKDISYALHANIIYRFTKYIEWPAYYNSEDFVIGIVGDTPLYDELEVFTENKTVGTRKIIIKRMSSTASFYNCNILFVSEDKSKSLKKIAEITKGSPILIVSETSVRALNGSCINFVIINEHLKLEINKSNIEDRDLSIASELLRLGTLVK
ncbi:MAG: YfiR family protein [Ginsengibacter sp.]